MGRRLTDRVALVFGAGSSGPGWGNGKAAAVLYAREGARVAAVDIEPAAAEETCGIITAEGGEALALAADATRGEAVAAAVARTVARFGRIDVLHNNVGATEMGDPVALSEERWQAALDVNLTGAFLACKHVLPIMLRQGKGAIVNVSSIAAERIGTYPHFVYAAAKAGQNQFTRALAVQYAAHGIRANAVMPGLIDTPLIYRQILGQHGDAAAMIAERSRRAPMGRMGDAWDVARAALFLASDEAGYITGACLPVDGGLSCCYAAPDGGFVPIPPPSPSAHCQPEEEG
jgi:NAD(P)-dependent dehydrogenase (short-subunit alcohol dehydrogenase family)